jgi:plasmid maintenance system killer protein
LAEAGAAVPEPERSRRRDTATERIAWRKLAVLDAAETLADLLIPPESRLEKLTGAAPRPQRLPGGHVL